MDPFTLALLGSTATSAIGGLMGSRASSAAAGQQSMAAMQSAMIQAQQAEEARRQQEKYYQEAKAAYSPYTQFGEQSTNRMASLLGVGGAPTAPGYGSFMRNFAESDITSDPVYAARMAEGRKALERMQAARGQGYLSGSTVRGSQELASLEGQNAYTRFMDQRAKQYAMLQGGVGTGLNAAQGLAGAATGTGANIANTLTGGGAAMGQGLENAAAARASGYMGSTSALQGALAAPTNAMMAYGMMNRFSPSNASTYQSGYLNGMPSMSAGFSPGFQGAPTAYEY